MTPQLGERISKTSLVETSFLSNFRHAPEIWPSIKKFVEHMQKPEHVKAQPDEKRSFKRCQLKFVYSIAMQLQPFLKKFQSDVPLVPFLAENLAKLLHSVMALLF